MKKVIKLSTCLLLFFFLSLDTFAQQYGQCSGISTTRNIKLEGSSDTEKIKVEVSDDIKDLNLNVNGTIKSGYLTVEIYDPKGNKKGNFSIESQISNNSKMKEMVCGQMSKQIKDPMKGNWVVKLIPKNVVGDISICTMQM